MAGDYSINGEKSFPVSSNIAQYIRVKISGTQTSLLASSTPRVAVAGIADVTIGITRRAAFVTTGPVGQTIDATVAVRLMSAQGTMNGTLNGDGAVAVGAAIYSAALGKVSGTAASTAILLGYAMSAGTSDGDIIEFLPL